MLSLSFTIKGNDVESDRAGGWTVTLELSGVMEASCFAVEGGRGSGEASASLSQRKLYTGAAIGLEQLGQGTRLPPVCTVSWICTIPMLLSLVSDHQQFVSSLLLNSILAVSS